MVYINYIMELTNKNKNRAVEVVTRRVRNLDLRTNLVNENLRKRFNFWGIVKKISNNGQSILIASGDKVETTYWMDFDSSSISVNEGDKCKFVITISTFVGKDKIIKTKLRVVEAYILPADADDELANGFSEGYGILDVNILSSQRTDIPQLFILTMERLDESGESKETYHMKYFNSKDRLHPEIGIFKVTFKLGKSKDLISSKGEIFTDIETRTYVNDDGETITKESPVYVPALAVRSIEK